MWTERLRSLILERKATFFEATTAIAFADFAARGAEIAVVEVGLGGRLDSTNVVRPLVSAVTKIERDHMKYLGDTLEKIAGEKAGIAKPGAPFVIGAGVLPAEYECTGPLGLAGPHQRRNAAVAHGILMALPPRWRPEPGAVARGFGAAWIPGRLDRRGKWLFDVAHNPDGIRSLIVALESLGPPRPLHGLISILGDKEWADMLVQLDRVIDRGILTVAPTAASRGWDAAWLRRWLSDPARPPARASWSLVPDFRAALEEVQRGAATILVTGSFHAVGDVMGELGL
jgi:dihydrofolate synthase/folylpolyglutamate synthase